MGPDQQRVWMIYRYEEVIWRVSFQPVGSTRTLPRVFGFGEVDKLRSLYTRFGSKRMSDDRLAFEFGLEQGSGRVELTLGPDEYRKLLSR